MFCFIQPKIVFINKVTGVLVYVQYLSILIQSSQKEEIQDLLYELGGGAGGTETV